MTLVSRFSIIKTCVMAKKAPTLKEKRIEAAKELFKRNPLLLCVFFFGEAVNATTEPRRIPYGESVDAVSLNEEGQVEYETNVEIPKGFINQKGKSPEKVTNAWDQVEKSLEFHQAVVADFEALETIDEPDKAKLAEHMAIVKVLEEITAKKPK